MSLVSSKNVENFYALPTFPTIFGEQQSHLVSKVTRLRGNRSGYFDHLSSLINFTDCSFLYFVAFSFWKRSFCFNWISKKLTGIWLQAEIWIWSAWNIELKATNCCSIRYWRRRAKDGLNWCLPFPTAPHRGIHPHCQRLATVHRSPARGILIAPQLALRWRFAAPFITPSRRYFNLLSYLALSYPTAIRFPGFVFWNCSKLLQTLYNPFYL